MMRPWFQMYSRDWLDNKELRRCSPLARAILVDLMCLAHEGFPYGHLADKVGALTPKFCASRCMVTLNQYLKAIGELTLHGRVSERDGVMIIPRMVADEDVRLRRAQGGKDSIGHPNTHPPKQKEGYPSDHPSLKNDSRAGVRADSDSGSLKEKEVIPFAAKITFEKDRDAAWLWFEKEFPGEVNPEWDAQIFVSVIQTFEDIRDLRENLPPWKATKRWLEGFTPSAENFLRKRQFKNKPKARDSPAQSDQPYAYKPDAERTFDPKRLAAEREERRARLGYGTETAD